MWSVPQCFLHPLLLFTNEVCGGWLAFSFFQFVSVGMRGRVSKLIAFLNVLLLDLGGDMKVASKLKQGGMFRVDTSSRFQSQVADAGRRVCHVSEIAYAVPGAISDWLKPSQENKHHTATALR